MSHHSLAAEYKLRLLYKRAFSEVLSEEQSSRDFGPLLGKMGVVNEQGQSAMDADQWEAASRSLPNDPAAKC
jgi:mRNA (guanine-N7-)-methyltransferase